nr:cytochrome P450 10 isoform X2 [Crassostrea gigas]
MFHRRMTRLICKTHYNSFQRALACQYVTSTVSRAFKGSEKCPGAARTLSHVPGPEGIYNVPFIGNALQFRSYRKNKDTHLFFRELHKQYGKMSRIRLGSKNCLILFDPELISKVMAHEGPYPERYPVPLMETYAKRTKRAMFNIQKGPDWQSIRSPAQQSIKPSVIKLYIPVQNQCAEELVTWLSNYGNNNPDIKEAFMRYSADANSVVAFDKKIGFLQSMGKSDPNPELQLFLRSISRFMELVGQSIYTVPTYKLWRTKLYTEFETAADNVYRISEKYVDEARTELENQRNLTEGSQSGKFGEEQTILRFLIQNGRMPNEFIVNFMTALLFGGVEQVSQFLMWMFWLLGQSPDKQEKLHNEIKTNIGDSPVTVDTLGHLPYLKACVKETFRRIPPIATGIARKILEDTEIEGYQIPKGTFVFFGNNTLSMSEEYFENPEDFLPERWLQGAHDPPTQRLMGLCVLPFGLGKRNCLGRRFAEQEIHLAAIKILQKFHVEITDDCREVRPAYTTFAVPDRPIKFIFNRR